MPEHVAIQLRHAGELWSDPILTAVADSIEEQVRPTIEEPTEFGSVVVAWLNHSSWTPKDRVRWLNDGSCWRAERDTYSAADVAPEETEDYRCGVQDTKVKVLQRLRNLRDGATGERQLAYGWAMDAVEGIA